MAGLACAALCAAAGTATAQRFRGDGRGYASMTIATERDFDGAFNFCRIAFRQNPNGDGGGWSADYPQADQNLSIRLSELTKTRISLINGEPHHLLLRLTDDVLFQCPFIMMTEVGAAYFDAAEAARLRAYLQKGGFLWADDFWGSFAWEVWRNEIQKVLPASEYPIVDLPKNHPVFHTQFVIPNGVPQISSINQWLATGTTSERGADSAEPHGRAIVDRHGRIMVFITHNTDFGDSWERESEDPTYFTKFSVKGYAVGIDVLLYAMTH